MRTILESPIRTCSLGLQASKFYNGGVDGDTSTGIMKRMLSATGLHKNLTVIWVGRNNYSNPETVKSDIAAIVSVISPPKRFVVLSVLNAATPDEFFGGGNYAIIANLNRDLAVAYPKNYLDIRAFLVSQYDPSIPQDVIDKSHDVPPLSLRTDYIHLNGKGYQLVASKVDQTCKGLNYIQ